MSRQSSVNVRAGRERDCNDTRTIFQLRCKSLRQIPLHDVAVAYESCRRLSGAQRDACYVAHDLDGAMVQAYFPIVQALERTFAPPPPPTKARVYLDRARDALFQLLPPSDSPLPDDTM